MKRVRLFVVAVGAVVIPALVGVRSAEAHNCSSVCNQIRRACMKSAKATRKADLATCDANRERCRAECQANAGSCLGDCDEANTACLVECDSAPNPTACGDECQADLVQCQDDCANCGADCGATRDTCRTQAQTARQEAAQGCDDSRLTCRDACVDPIDGHCVRGCKSDRRDCKGLAKKDERDCKKACDRGPARKACVRECRRVMNLALGVCSDEEVLCLGGCAGLTAE